MQITKRRLKLASIALISFTFISSLILYISSEKAYRFAGRLLGSFQPKIDNVVNEINFIRTYQKHMHPIDPANVFDLRYSQADLLHHKKDIEFFLSSDGYFIRDDWKKWRKAEMIVSDTQKYKIKYKFHGSASGLYAEGGFSLKIKHGKDGKYLERKRRYNLISGKEMDITVLAANKVARTYGLMAPVGKIILLKINANVMGDFYCVDEFSKESLERDFKITEYAVFRPNDDWDRKQPVSHISDFDLDYQNIQIDGSSSHLNEAFGRYKNFLQAIKRGDVDEVKTYIDINYMGKFLAICYTMNNSHFISGDNTRFIYNFASGKFYPIYRQETGVFPVSEKAIINYNKNFFNSHSKYVNDLSHKMYKLLVCDDELRRLRDENLFKIINDESNIMNIYKEVKKESWPTYLHSPSTNTVVLKNKYSMDMYNLSNNIKFAKLYLSYGKVFITTSTDTSGYIKASVLNDCYANVKLLAYDTTGAIVNPITENGVLPAIRVTYTTTFNNSYPETVIRYPKHVAEFKAVNQITGDTFSHYNVYVSSIVEFNKATLSKTEQELKENNISYTLSNNNFTIKAGSYNISRDIYFAKGYSVTIEEGTTIKLMPEKSVLIQGDFNAEASADKPIVITNAIQGKPFGSFAINGDINEGTKVRLRYVNVSNGNETLIEGMHFLGQMSVYNADLTMDHCLFENSYSDDGFNTKYCTIRVTNCSFIDNSYDQMDADYCTGYITGCTFSGTRYTKKLENGDGLDISGSLVRVENCTFKDCTDKGISFGEAATIYLENNIITGNITASAIKDNCIIYASNNTLKNNEKGWVLYIKKPFYPNPKLYMYKESDKVSIADGQGEFIVLTEKEFFEIVKREFKKTGI